MLKILPASHVDHALTQEHLDFLLTRYADRDGSFIDTVELPAHLGPLPCGIHGPIMGDEPVGDDECQLAPRGTRTNLSRLCGREPRLVRQMTVIAGPHAGEACVLYTSYGGPLAPKEPTDPTLKDSERQASEDFWKVHALSR
jgi:hypothetical protein